MRSAIRHSVSEVSAGARRVHPSSPRVTGRILGKWSTTSGAALYRRCMTVTDTQERLAGCQTSKQTFYSPKSDTGCVRYRAKNKAGGGRPNIQVEVATDLTVDLTLRQEM
mgnify:CR=1 FL=1